MGRNIRYAAAKKLFQNVAQPPSAVKLTRHNLGRLCYTTMAGGISEANN